MFTLSDALQLPNIVTTQCGPFPTATYAGIVAMPIHLLAHDQCRSFGVVLGPLHLPHQLEVGRDGGATMTRPMQVVEHHHIERVGMALGEGRRGEARGDCHTAV